MDSMNIPKTIGPGGRVQQLTGPWMSQVPRSAVTRLC
jgi:hypothetical protein